MCLMINSKYLVNYYLIDINSSYCYYEQFIPGKRIVSCILTSLLTLLEI